MTATIAGRRARTSSGEALPTVMRKVVAHVLKG